MDRVTPDKIDMIFIYGEAGRNIRAACRLYAGRYPDRHQPSRTSFRRVVQQFTTTGSIVKKKKMRKKSVTDENAQIAVLAAVAHNPHVSTREIAGQSGISRTSIGRILKQQKFHPYHISMHQDLHGTDFGNRVQFCEWAQQKIRDNNNFFRNVLFSDESTFTNHGQINRHNMHYWATDNPRWLRQVERQRPWNVNVWCGIIGTKIIGPFFIIGNLDGNKYSDFLHNVLPTLLEDVPLERRATMWYQHDGCPAHYSQAAREILNRVYGDHWIGRGGPTPWPARSPDLTPLDYFLWGSMKEKVYRTAPTTPEDMQQRIINACSEITEDVLKNVHDSFSRRILKCIEVEGQHFEHLL